MYDCIVYIGRFQPLHNGHMKVVEAALAKSKRLIIMIGSHEQSMCTRNPFSTKRRMEMFNMAMTSEQWNKTTFIPIRDSNYDYEEWLNRTERIILKEIHEGDKVALIGHKKADVGYLRHIRDWDVLETHLFEDGLSGTKVRELLMSGYFDSAYDLMPPKIEILIEKWREEEWFKDLIEEWKKVQSYRASWASAPYPPTFIAGDNIYIHGEELLLVRRKGVPGKGQLAMPGGFLDINESMKQCAIRELIEETSIKKAPRELEELIIDSYLFDDPKRAARGRMLSNTYLYYDKMSILQPKPEVKANDDAAEIVWLPIKELDSHRDEMFNDHYKIIKFMLKRNNIDGNIL